MAPNFVKVTSTNNNEKHQYLSYDHQLASYYQNNSKYHQRFDRMQRRKSLLIGINYLGSNNELKGCFQDVENVAEFIKYRGYSDGPQDQIVLRDDLEEKYSPTGHNLLAAIDWLVSEEHTTCFFHYSGHGGQVDDPSGKRPSGLLDTIVPVDFEENGQIDSDTLHKHLVTRLPPSSTLFLILDCCHSGSTLELPYVYRSDDGGNIRQLDGFSAGMRLMSEAAHVIKAGFSFDAEAQARDLYAGATSFFRSLKHRRQVTGLETDDFTQEWAQEKKTITMFAGCRDEETSADAQINGVAEGAMSWAFLESMKNNPDQTYAEALHSTRALLKASEYTQIPQLCVGVEMDLDRPLIL